VIFAPLIRFAGTSRSVTAPCKISNRQGVQSKLK